uniref:Uncharacterized protein n=1 Tax=Cacopsylla melanoneura TaxID=428564 RepID=A0A8D9E2N2_9HEMI
MMLENSLLFQMFLVMLVQFFSIVIGFVTSHTLVLWTIEFFQLGIGFVPHLVEIFAIQYDTIGNLIFGVGEESKIHGLVRSYPIPSDSHCRIGEILVTVGSVELFRYNCSWCWFDSLSTILDVLVSLRLPLGWIVIVWYSVEVG